MPFYEIEFYRHLLAVAYKGGNEFLTTIVTSKSGDESRNRVWSFDRLNLQCTLITKDNDARLAAYTAIEDFFRCMSGRWAGFRFFNFRDYQFTDSPVLGFNGGSALGDGATLDFQLSKTYSVGGGLATYQKAILKPITSSVVDPLGNSLTDTVTVKVDGSPVGLGGSPASVTLDHTTGKLSFASPPSTNAVITASGQFDIPVRFDLDKLEGVNRAKDVLDSGAINRIELKNPQSTP